MGSEPGMGWNWCVHLAKYCELHIITEGEFRDNIEKVLPTLEQGKNMHFYYLPIGGDDEKKSKKIRKRCWNQGDWRFYIDYAKWQKRVLIQARKICEKQEIDILHQLNMIGFREPGYLWQISRDTGIPFVWGPTNAKEAFPVIYLRGASIQKRMFIYLKNAITRFQLRTSYKVHRAAQMAAVVIAASTDSANSIKKFLKVDPIVINESGCYIVKKRIEHIGSKETLDLLWVGRFIFTKQLCLALQSLAATGNSQIRIHIVGGSFKEEKKYKQEAQALGIEEQCIWHEKIPHDKVQELMQQCDLFFFTSIAEGTPHVILEAFNNNLPVLCFDTCGQGDCVNNDVGIKIPLSTPNQSVKDFAEKIEYLYAHREVLARMSENCKKRAEELSWENKAKQMVGLYEKAIEELKVNVY